MDDVRHWLGGVDRRAPLIPSFEALRCATFDPSDLAPTLRAFYETTSSHDLEMRSVRWERWSIPLMLAYTRTARWGLGNMYMPPTTDTPRAMTSAIHPVRWSDATESRLWVRTFRGSGQIFYVASVRDAVVDGRAYLSVAFPVRAGHLLVVLRLTNAHGAGMVADSRDDRWAGTYLARPRDDGALVLPGPPTAERLAFAPAPDGTIDGTHEGFLGGRRTFRVEYAIS